MNRRTILRGMLAAGGVLALGACASGTTALRPGTGGNARLSGGRVSARWLGGGVVELATPGSGTTPAGAARDCEAARVRDERWFRKVRGRKTPGRGVGPPHA